MKGVFCVFFLGLAASIGCFHLYAFNASHTDGEYKLVANDVELAEVDFEIESGSFLLKYTMKDKTKCTLILECPSGLEEETLQIPKIAFRTASKRYHPDKEEVLSFFRDRLTKYDVSSEEAGFIAVTLISMHGFAPIQSWGFAAARIDGNWQAVFRKPVSGLVR